MGKRIVLADPRGFCAGVDRAILTVRTILKSADTPRADGLPPVYVRRQIVHNKHVVEDLAAQGAVFVQELAEIPDAAAEAGIPIVFSAHGVSPAVKAEAAARGMHVVDATCPLVSKVHREVLRFVKEGYEIIYIGHKGHDEAVGVVEESPEHVHLIEHASDVDSLDFQPDTKLVLLTQTTLSVDETAGTITALKARFPWLEMPPNSDICYATSNRQAAVKLVAEQADCVVIVGSANSSNSVRRDLTRGTPQKRLLAPLVAPIVLMMLRNLTPHGLKVSNPWVFPRVPPCRTSWFPAWSQRCKNLATRM